MISMQMTEGSSNARFKTTSAFTSLIVNPESGFNQSNQSALFKHGKWLSKLIFRHAVS